MFNDREVVTFWIWKCNTSCAYRPFILITYFSLLIHRGRGVGRDSWFLIAAPQHRHFLGQGMDFSFAVVVWNSTYPKNEVILFFMYFTTTSSSTITSTTTTIRHDDIRKEEAWVYPSTELSSCEIGLVDSLTSWSFSGFIFNRHQKYLSRSRQVWWLFFKQSRILWWCFFLCFPCCEQQEAIRFSGWYLRGFIECLVICINNLFYSF